MAECTKLPEEVTRERHFLKRKIKALAAEYHAKVTYDFSRYIYVGVKEKCQLMLEEAIDFITTCAGYQAHRLVTYGQVVSSIYVRFADQSYAAAAADRLSQQEEYWVDMVSAMLLSWYLEEMLKGNFPWTLAVVSTEGRSEHSNPLSEDALRSILMQFGDPRINSYQIGNQIEHVQVLFSSMAEALGASIIYGRWFVGCVKENSVFHYHIQIMGSDKEATLLRGVQPKKPEPDQELEAFKMDYFVQKMEIKAISYKEDDSYYPRSLPSTATRDLRSPPRVREFRRQFSRGRGGGRGRGSNPQWAYENRNSRKFQNYTNQILPRQELANLQNQANLQE